MTLERNTRASFSSNTEYSDVAEMFRVGPKSEGCTKHVTCNDPWQNPIRDSILSFSFQSCLERIMSMIERGTGSFKKCLWRSINYLISLWTEIPRLLFSLLRKAEIIFLTSLTTFRIVYPTFLAPSKPRELLERCSSRRLGVRIKHASYRNTARWSIYIK